MSAVAVAACPPGEFEDHAGLLVSLTEATARVPHTVVDLVRLLGDRIPLIAIVDGEAQRQEVIVLLTDWGLPAHQIHFLSMPVCTWARDFSPAFVRLTDGRVVLVDSKYPHPDSPNEDMASKALAAHLDLPLYRAPLAMYGGNLLSNGRGMCLFTSGMVGINRCLGHNYGEGDVKRILTEWYGFDQPVMLEPLQAHRTLHVDMFCTFVAHDTVIVGQCDPATDPASAAALDRNAALLAGLSVGRSGGGNPLRVHRIPMPAYDGKRCRTYTNVAFANGRLLVPHYSDVAADVERRVMNTYAELLPGWELAQINCDEIILSGGALRCLTKHIPWMYDRFRHRAARPWAPHLAPSMGIAAQSDSWMPAAMAAW